MSMSNTTWLYAHYEQLAEEYAEYCVLVREEKVVFTDKSTRVVLNYAMKHFPDLNWEIAMIDSGEAALY